MSSSNGPSRRGPVSLSVTHVPTCTFSYRFCHHFNLQPSQPIPTYFKFQHQHVSAVSSHLAPFSRFWCSVSSCVRIKMQTGHQAGESNLRLVVCNTSTTNMSISTDPSSSRYWNVPTAWWPPRLPLGDPTWSDARVKIAGYTDRGDYKILYLRSLLGIPFGSIGGTIGWNGDFPFWPDPSVGLHIRVLGPFSMFSSFVQAKMYSWIFLRIIWAWIQPL